MGCEGSEMKNVSAKNTFLLQWPKVVCEVWWDGTLYSKVRRGELTPAPSSRDQDQC